METFSKENNAIVKKIIQIVSKNEGGIAIPENIDEKIKNWS
jgi:hypothetical protein